MCRCRFTPLGYLIDRLYILHIGICNPIRASKKTYQNYNIVYESIYSTYICIKRYIGFIHTTHSNIISQWLVYKISACVVKEAECKKNICSLFSAYIAGLSPLFQRLPLEQHPLMRFVQFMKLWWRCRFVSHCMQNYYTVDVLSCALYNLYVRELSLNAYRFIEINFIIIEMLYKTIFVHINENIVK